MQVVKDPLKTKGARLSMELTIAGRYLVYAPTGQASSSRVASRTANVSGCAARPPSSTSGGGGAIVRTAAHGAKRADFERELQYLHKLHEVLDRRVKETPPRRSCSRRRTSR